MKTIHTESNNIIDRIKGWIVEQDNLVRCVAWVGNADNNPKRCI